MAKTSREKGKRGERELAGILRRLWRGKARRTAQVDGGLAGDITGALACAGPPYLEWHIECKRIKAMPRMLWGWLNQAEEDSKGPPALGDYMVCFREDGGQWFVVLPLHRTVGFAQDIMAQRTG